MNDETPINEEDAAMQRKRRLPDGLPEPVERAGFALQERLIWPLQDRFALLGPGPSRIALLGGGAAALVAGVAVAIALSSGSGGGSSTPVPTSVQAATSQREPLVAAAPEPSKPAAQEPPRETLHGAAPVFSPPSPASKGGEKTGEPKAAAADATGSGGDSATASSSSDASSGSASEAGAGDSTSSSPSPAGATISSDPNRSSKAAEGDAAGAATAARATVPAGPPAPRAALKVAREFAEGFVVYETGGEASAFKQAFTVSATPELKKALLQRPPKQPAGAKVPRAKVLNVVAGPSHGTVYKVSVSLLRVGVTSELRLDMEKVKTAGQAAGDTAGSGKSAEWRVTNVLG